MNQAGGGTPERVLLLHGLNAGPWMMWPVARALRRAGYTTSCLAYRSRDWPLARIVDTLTHRIAAEIGDAPFCLIGHSMGALVAQALAARLPEGQLQRVVMLAPPAKGSEWVTHLRRLRIDRIAIRHAADLLTPARDPAISAMLAQVRLPVGVIAGDRSGPLDRRFLPQPHDGRVSVAATHVEGQADHIVLPVSHTSMLWNRAVHLQILAFLDHGRFNPEASGMEPDRAA